MQLKQSLVLTKTWSEGRLCGFRKFSAVGSAHDQALAEAQLCGHVMGNRRMWTENLAGVPVIMADCS